MLAARALEGSNDPSLVDATALYDFMARNTRTTGKSLRLDYGLGDAVPYQRWECHAGWEVGHVGPGMSSFLTTNL